MPRDRRTPRQHGPTERGRADTRPTGGTFFTPQASAFRRTVERRSAAALVLLHRTPRWVAPGAMVALLLAGVAAPRWLGAVAFLALASFLAWLCYLSWPTLQARGRLLRAVAILVVLAAAAGRAAGLS